MGKTVKCRSCDKELVFLFTNSGSAIPVDKESLTRNEVIKIELGRSLIFRFTVHNAHFITCPNLIKREKRNDE